ncbi:MAG: S8 family peptidase [Cyclobacteriaceae bacterium]
MAVTKKSIVFFFLLFLIQVLHAQERYVVFFSDKEGSTFSTDRPLEFLSQRAIDRREKAGFDVSDTDFPVNQNYLDSLTKHEITYHYTSRWFNAALVEVEESKLEAIVDKSFIASYDLVAKRINNRNRYADNPSPENLNFNGADPDASSSSSNVQLNMLAAKAMHEDGYTGGGKWIAVFDGGFNGVNESNVFKHLFNNDLIIDTEDIVTGGKDVFLRDDHGTQVLSCISSNYNEQMVGTGYGANISLYITEDIESEFRIEEYNWLIAAEKADSSGVDIISCSLGYDSFFDDSSMNYKVADLDGKTAVVTRAAEMASERGMLVVNSAGNALDRQIWDLVSFPSDGENVLSVASVTGNREKSGFSMTGPTADNRIKPDVAAMGSSTVVVDDSGNIVKNNGTSFSCPLIAGFSASLWQAFPDLNNKELRQLILESSSQSDSPDNSLGYGIPNYYKAIGEVLSIESMAKEQIEIFPNPIMGNIISIRFNAVPTNGELNFELYNSEGKLIVSEKRQKVISNSSVQLEIPNLEKGIYILSIIGSDSYNGFKLLKF